MKKQISFIAIIVIAATTFSCNKQGSDIPQQQTATDQQAMSNQPGQGIILIDPLSVGLQGRFEFDGNLIDKTGKLQNAVSNTGYAWYTYNRKNEAKKAVKLDGKYILSIYKVPHDVKMSVASWVRFDDPTQMPCNFICSNSDGPRVMQAFDQYYGFNNPAGNPYIGSGATDTKWHHVATTIDGTNLRFYFDGVLKGTVASPDTYADLTASYFLGYGYVYNKPWHGAIDDLRFYNRTLSDADVATLAKQ